MGIPLFRVAFALFISSATQTPASETWPQWGGPARNFNISNQELAESWPATGPRVLWSTTLGPGYSGIVADTDSIYTMFRETEHEVVVALNRADGRTRWAFRYLETFKGEGYGAGPNASPLLISDRVIALGAGGKLYALDRRFGDALWSHDLVTEFEAETPWHGFSSSPIAFEGMVILPVGGKDGRGIMAFDVTDGRVVWQNLAILLGYSSPMLIDVDGQPQIVVYSKNNMVGVDPCVGTLLWEIPHRHIPQHNAALMPVWAPDHILWTSVRTVGEGDGARAFKLRRSGEKTEVTELYWKPKQGVEPYSNAVRIGSNIYTSNGYGSRARFVAIDAATGEAQWQYRGVGTTNCLAVGDRLIVLGESGTLCLARPTSDGPGIGSRIQLRTTQAWTAPTLAGTQLYIRDQERISAFELGPPEAPPVKTRFLSSLPKIAFGTLLLLAGYWLWPRHRRVATSPEH